LSFANTTFAASSSMTVTPAGGAAAAAGACLGAAAGLAGLRPPASKTANFAVLTAFSGMAASAKLPCCSARRARRALDCDYKLFCERRRRRGAREPKPPRTTPSTTGPGKMGLVAARKIARPTEAKSSTSRQFAGAKRARTQQTAGSDAVAAVSHHRLQQCATNFGGIRSGRQLRIRSS